MQRTGGGYGGGLARFQSVPAAWLEALLLSDEDMIIDPPKSTFNQHPSVTTTNFGDQGVILPGHDSGFLIRQNSSPVEFLAHVNSSDDYCSNYGVQVKADCGGYLSSALDVKQSKEGGFKDSQIKFSTQMDSSPIKVRAKRGFATHPRSIAERVRRTKISDRIRKLQELVPNMDKQTNTADMLEEAVEYVKYLQNQIQDLTEHQSKCTCYS